ncbi:MAG: lysozyme, partial [Pseudomonadales bacterium]|nr:lysozyme [Pseudomonadales bacterium]
MSEQLREMLRRHEGVRNFVYMCSEGYETIGVGRNIADSGVGLSDDEVDYLLDNDIKRVREELNDEYYWFGALNAARQEAMIDISFNLGQTRLRGFKKALDAMSSE